MAAAATDTKAADVSGAPSAVHEGNCGLAEIRESPWNFANFWNRTFFVTMEGRGSEPDPQPISPPTSRNYASLAKDDESLRAKAKDRWYVPDPNKAGDLEKLRERALLREFWEYLPPGYKPTNRLNEESYLPGLAPKALIPRGKRFKVIRLEAVRAGFKHCWQNRDYGTIIAVAERIPENVLQEDPKLLMWYDQAITRVGEE